MADRYRRGSSTRVAINCRSRQKRRLTLNQLAGKFAIEYAIELLVAEQSLTRYGAASIFGISRIRTTSHTNIACARNRSAHSWQRFLSRRG
jgi:hypothetical protein